MKPFTITFRPLAFALAAVVSAPVATTFAGELIENHYKVYEVPESFVVTGDIRLNDQFGEFLTTVVLLDKFANPVDKNAEGIPDTTLHQTWWEIDDPEPVRTVEMTNQFGTQTLTLGNGRYLVLPAHKNDTSGPPPPGDGQHYKCYEAEGTPVDSAVVLVDQFDVMTTVATVPKYFCNPVEKMFEGVVSPIVDPEQHMTCYELGPSMPVFIPLLAWDQFGPWQLTAAQTEWLCVPSAKLTVVSTESSTWGRIKSRYRE
jgi:hypothetical protein